MSPHIFKLLVVSPVKNYIQKPINFKSLKPHFFLAITCKLAVNLNHALPDFRTLCKVGARLFGSGFFSKIKLIKKLQINIFQYRAIQKETILCYAEEGIFNINLSV